VGLIVATLGAQRRGAKGGEDGAGGWGCSPGPFYRAGDREVVVEGVTDGGLVELRGATVSALISH
jgi:hypothetical protein